MSPAKLVFFPSQQIRSHDAPRSRQRLELVAAGRARDDGRTAAAAAFAEPVGTFTAAAATAPEWQIESSQRAVESEFGDGEWGSWEGWCRDREWEGPAAAAAADNVGVAFLSLSWML